jgi:hypothetical protein
VCSITFLCKFSFIEVTAQKLCENFRGFSDRALMLLLPEPVFRENQQVVGVNYRISVEVFGQQGFVCFPGITEVREVPPIDYIIVVQVGYITCA